MPTLEAPIAAVTVFTDRARVTRRGRVRLDAGAQVITVGGLPAVLAPESVRVGGRGAGITITGVDVATEFVVAPPEEDLRALEGELETLREQDRALADEDAAAESRLQFLTRLRDAGATDLARGLAYGRATIDSIQTLAGFLAAEETAVAARRRAIAAQRREVQRQIEALQRRIGQVRPPVPEARRAVRVSAEAAAAAELELELTYVVNGAWWEPIYDLRLDGERVALTYAAQVRQQSGEDWPPAELALSTARPAVSQSIPELQPWYLDVFRPPPPRPAPMFAMAAPAARMATADLADEALAGAAPEAAPPADVAQATIETSGASVTYRVPRPIAIPSDGSPHRAAITALDLPARLDYITAPKLAEEAYLRAVVTNDSPAVLLPGQASIFRAAEFAGTTRLELVAPGEEFELQLGVDDRLRVERELTSRKVDKTLLTNIRRTQFSYRIKLANLLPIPTRVTVLDQLPVSRHEEIKVRLLDATPRPAEQSDLQVLTWTLELPAGGRAEIAFSFQVEHPREMQVVGLG
jgi:uncharacterized protein (TIGR02231 family)